MCVSISSSIASIYITYTLKKYFCKCRCQRIKNMKKLAKMFRWDDPNTRRCRLHRVTWVSRATELDTGLG